MLANLPTRVQLSNKDFIYPTCTHHVTCFFCVSDLAEKIQDLNQIKKNKAEQLKHLEDQVIAIKNEMVKQSNKHANCKS